MKPNLLTVMAIANATMHDVSDKLNLIHSTDKSYNWITHKHRKHRRGRPK